MERSFHQGFGIVKSVQSNESVSEKENTGAEEGLKQKGLWLVAPLAKLERAGSVVKSARRIAHIAPNALKGKSENPTVKGSGNTEKRTGLT